MSGGKSCFLGKKWNNSNREKNNHQKYEVKDCFTGESPPLYVPLVLLDYEMKFEQRGHCDLLDYSWSFCLINSNSTKPGQGNSSGINGNILMSSQKIHNDIKISPFKDELFYYYYYYYYFHHVSSFLLVFL